MAILSKRVVVGRVVAVEPFGTEMSPRSIVTLAVSQDLLGSGEATIRFVQDGSPSRPLPSTVLAAEQADWLLFLTDEQGGLLNSGGEGQNLPTNLVTPFMRESSLFRPVALSTLPPIDLQAFAASITGLEAVRARFGAGERS